MTTTVTDRVVQAVDAGFKVVVIAVTLDGLHQQWTRLKSEFEEANTDTWECYVANRPVVYGVLTDEIDTPPNQTDKNWVSVRTSNSIPVPDWCWFDANML